MRVSVVCPVFNAAPFLGQAAASALQQAQTGELLLIDDGSNDGSYEACQQLQAAHPDRVRVLTHPDRENRGVSATRNLGIREARCDFVAFLDADDWYLDNRFAAAQAKFEQDPSLDAVYDPVKLVFDSDDGREHWDRSHAAVTEVDVAGNPTPDELADTLLRSGTGAFHTNSVVARRTFFDTVGLFDPSLSVNGPGTEDTHLWLRMALVGRLARAGTEPVATYRMHATNSWHRQNAADQWVARARMDRSLLAWAWVRGVGWPRRRMILRRVLNSERKMQCYSKRWLQPLISFARIGGLGVRFPAAVATRRYWFALTLSLLPCRLVGWLLGRRMR